MKLTQTSSKWTAAMKFNATAGKPLNSLAGETVTIEACALGEDVSAETGELVQTCYLSTVEEGVITSVSRTVGQQVEALIEMDEFPISVKIVSRKAARSKREFYTLDMV